jgi:arylsulfatase A-like enzyme
MSEIHVPLVLSLPGRLPEASRVREPVSIRDVPATVMQLVNLPASSGTTLPGASLTRFFDGGSDRSPGGSEVVSEAPLAELLRPARGWIVQRSINLGDFHYIRFQDGREELYNLAIDPQEQRDLSRDPAHAPQLDATRAALEAHTSAGSAARSPLRKNQISG